MTPTKIPTPKGNIIVVEVPDDATEFKISDRHLWFGGREQKGWGKWNRNINTQNILKENAEAELLGCIDHGVIDFDCSEFVITYSLPTFREIHKYQNYEVHGNNIQIEVDKNFFDSPNDSFLSLLRSHGIDLNKKYVCLIIKN